MENLSQDTAVESAQLQDMAGLDGLDFQIRSLEVDLDVWWFPENLKETQGK